MTTGETKRCNGNHEQRNNLEAGYNSDNVKERLDSFEKTIYKIEVFQTLVEDLCPKIY